MGIVSYLLRQHVQVLEIQKGHKKPVGNGWSKPAELMPYEPDGRLLQERLDKGECGLGILCGSFSNVTAIDIDSDDQEKIDAVVKYLGKSPYAKKGKKGVTFFYQHNGEKQKKLKFTGGAQGEGIDVLADASTGGGSNTVIPPSVHPDTGEQYVWCGEKTNGFPVDSLPKISKEQWDAFYASGVIVTEDAAELPAVVGDYAVNQYAGVDGIESLLEAYLSKHKPDCEREDWINLAFSVNSALSGDRGYNLFLKWSRSAEGADQDPEETERQLHKVFKSNQPQGKRSQRTIASLAYRCGPKFYEKLPAAAKKAAKTIKESVAGAELIKRVKAELPAFQYDFSATPDYEGSFEPVVLAEQCVQLHLKDIFKYNIASKNDKIVVYNKETKRWAEVSSDDHSVIGSLINKHVYKVTNSKEFMETCVDSQGIFSPDEYDKAKKMFRSFAVINSMHFYFMKQNNRFDTLDPTDLDKVEHYVQDSEGTVVDMRNGKTVDVLPTEHFTPSKTKVPYNPDAPFPTKCVDFIKDVLSESEEPEEMFRFMHMLLGVCMSGSVSEQRLFMFVGSGANGKSTLMNMVSAVLGSYVGRVESSKMARNKYNAEHLERTMVKAVCSRMLVFADAPTGLTIDESFLKHITEEEMFVRPLFVEGYDASNRSTPVMCCNDLPDISNHTRAVLRRIAIVPFNKEYDTSDKELGKSYSELVEAYKGEERQGLFNWMMEGYQMYLANGGKLDYPREAEVAHRDYELSNDILKAAIFNLCGNPAELTAESCTPTRWATLKDINEALQVYFTSIGDAEGVGMMVQDSHAPHGSTNRKLSKAIKALGYDKKRAGTGMLYKVASMVADEMPGQPEQQMNRELNAAVGLSSLEDFS